MILFDLDGTLTDPCEGITNSAAYALGKFNINVTDKTELKKFIGPPLLESFMEFYNFSEEQAKQAIIYYREYFKDKGILENLVFEGTGDFLAKLVKENKRLCVATTKPEHFAKIILEHFNLSQYFEYIAGAEFDGTRTQKNEIIVYALGKCGFNDRSKVIMIGDRKHDIIGAKKCGIDSVGVLFGYGSREELETAGADYIAESFSDIEKIVL